MPQPRTLKEYNLYQLVALSQRPLTPAEREFQAALQADADAIERERYALLRHGTGLANSTGLLAASSAPVAPDTRE
jgi:hypothetical protein